MDYIKIQNEVVAKYRIKLNPDSDCWGRTHAHPKKRMVCKWQQRNSKQSTFTLFHEIGHVMTKKGWMRRAESEFYATVWALEECLKYGIKVTKKTFDLYQDYIDRELDRGLRRGGKGYGKMSLSDALGKKLNEILE